jgi:ATP-dependent protease Clp ATPase subunit
MVAGPGVYICNQCVELSIEVLEKRGVPVNHWAGGPSEQS